MSSSSSKGRLADLFYETETEYYGLPPFGLLDEIGESVVNAVLSMFERVPKSLTQQIDFLSAAQIDSVFINFYPDDPLIGLGIRTMGWQRGAVNFEGFRTFRKLLFKKCSCRTGGLCPASSCNRRP